MFVSSGAMFSWDLVFFLFKHIASNERGRDFCQKKKNSKLYGYFSPEKSIFIFFYF